MASKFIPPVDVLNNISPKKSRRSYSDQSRPSIFHEIKKGIKESYATDAFEQVGTLTAVVLEVIDAGDPSKQAWKHPNMNYSLLVKKKVPDFVEIRYRVPELHAHLPEPKDATDYAAINTHPIAIMKKDKSIPTPGDYVKIDFEDKANFKGAYVVETFDNQEGPSVAGNCSPKEVANSFSPVLNVSAPEGDTSQTDKKDLSAKNNPSSRSLTEGIAQSPLEINESYYKNSYIISIDEFYRLQDFLNVKETVNVLSSKNVFSVIFTIAESGNVLRDLVRLRRVVKELYESSIKVSLMIKTTELEFNSSNEVLRKVLNENRGKISDLHFYPIGKYDTAELKKDYDSLNSRINTHFIITEFLEVDDYGSIEDSSVFLADNTFDYNSEKKGDSSIRQEYAGEFKESYPLYYLGGINFIKTPDDPCTDGERTKQILDNNVKKGSKKYIFENYEFLRFEKEKVIEEKTVFSPSQNEKQNFLNSRKQIQTTNQAPGIVPETSDSIPGKTEPSFNSKEGSKSQGANTATASNYSTAPGTVCTPVSNGATSLGGPGGTINSLSVLSAFAQKHGISEALLSAVVKVESGAIVLVDSLNNTSGFPVIRFENHVAARRAKEQGKLSEFKSRFSWNQDVKYKGHKLDGEAIHVGAVSNESQRRERQAVQAAEEIIGREAAYQSMSIGIGQLMGFHYKKVGEASAESMFETAKKGLDAQLSQFCAFLENDKGGKMIQALKQRDLPKFVHYYNGCDPNSKKEALRKKNRDYVNKILEFERKKQPLSFKYITTTGKKLDISATDATS